MRLITCIAGFLAALCVGTAPWAAPAVDFTDPSLHDRYDHVRLPLDRQVSFFHDLREECRLNVAVDGYVHLASEQAFTAGAGALLIFDTSRLPAVFDLATLELVVAWPADFDGPAVNLEIFEVAEPWTSIGDLCGVYLMADPDVRLDFEVWEPPFCRRDPLELTTGLVEAVTFLAAMGEDAGGTRQVLKANITDLVRRWAVQNTGLFLRLAPTLDAGGRTVDAFTFYGTGAAYAPLRPSVNIVVLEGTGASACPDGICDVEEEAACPEDCALPADGTGPTVTLSFSPDVTRTALGQEITVSAEAADPSGITGVSVVNPSTKRVFCSETGTHCETVLSTTALGYGEHSFCARARDAAENLAETCRTLRVVGSGVPPAVSLAVTPSDPRPGDPLLLHIEAADPHEGLAFGSVTVQWDGQPYFQETYTDLQGAPTWSRDLAVPLCTWGGAGGLDDESLAISVSVTDRELSTSQAAEALQVLRPVQTLAGFKDANKGALLYFDQYALTFGDRVYASITACDQAPGISIPGCHQTSGCRCYSLTPYSVAAKPGVKMARWVHALVQDAAGGSWTPYLGAADFNELGLPDPLSFLFYPLYHGAGAAGQCTGFTTASQGLLTERLDPAEVNPFSPEASIGRWDYSDAGFFLGHRQGMVISSEFIRCVLESRAESAGDIISDIKEAQETGTRDGISILGFPIEGGTETLGHTMLVDHVRDLGKGRYRISVYDPDRPVLSTQGDQALFDPLLDYCSVDTFPFVLLDTANGAFEFITAAGDLWVDRPGAGNGTPALDASWLTRLPADLLLKDTYTLPAAPEGLAVLVFLNADGIVEDAAGHRLGTGFDPTAPPIPGGMTFALPGGNAGPVVIAYPVATEVTVEVTGNPDESHFFGILWGQRAGAVLLGEAGASSNFRLRPGRRLDMEVNSGGHGSLHVFGRQLVSLADFAGLNPTAAGAGATSVEIDRVYTLRGALGDEPLVVAIGEEGLLNISSRTERPVQVHALTNDLTITSGPEGNAVIEPKGDERDILLTAADMSLFLDRNSRTEEGELRLFPQGAPVLSPWTSGTAIPVTASRALLAPRLDLSGLDVEGDWQAYLALADGGKLYFKEADGAWREFKGGAPPSFATLSRPAGEAEFPIAGEMDLTGLKGHSLEMYLGIAKGPDLSGLIWAHCTMAFN